jgi:undecaprenyl-diphosphatase
MRRIVIAEPTALDLRARRAAHTRAGRLAGRALSPLFPIGLPGGYLVIAYATAHWIRRRGRSGGGSIVASAWLGWLLHRAVKVVLVRERPPRPDRRSRIDSFPSGHTTGATALAVTSAIVLRREGLLTTRAAVALGVGAPLVMGTYRVVADDHWATDVLGGWALGSAIAALSIMGPRRPRLVRRHVRREAQTFGGSAGRGDYADARARIARPFDR